MVHRPREITICGRFMSFCGNQTVPIEAFHKGYTVQNLAKISRNIQKNCQRFKILRFSSWNLGPLTHQIQLGNMRVKVLRSTENGHEVYQQEPSKYRLRSVSWQFWGKFSFRNCNWAGPFARGDMFRFESFWHFLAPVILIHFWRGKNCWKSPPQPWNSHKTENRYEKAQQEPSRMSI